MKILKTSYRLLKIEKKVRTQLTTLEKVKIQ